MEISRPKEVVWAAITDSENCSQIISSTIGIDILNRPGEGILGLRWKETRRMIGKEASEILWITGVVGSSYYCTRAESHGPVYISKLSLNEKGNNTLSAMSLSAQAQSCLLGVFRFV